MSIFENTTRAYVSSTLYSLAGDPDRRPNLRRAMILNTVLDPRGDIAESIKRSLLSGTGMKHRRFLSWCERNHPELMPVSTLLDQELIDTSRVISGMRTHLGLSSNTTLRVFSAFIGPPDFQLWAREHVRTNLPHLTALDWTTTYDRNASQIHIDVIGGNRVTLAAPSELVWALANKKRRLLYVDGELVVRPSHPALPIQFQRHFWAYRLGTGIASLDRLLKEAPSEDTPDGFYPALPLRLNNVSIRDHSDADLREKTEKAFKKLTGSRVGKLLDQLEENANISDIDHCFLVQGVAMNTKEPEEQRYIWEFLRLLARTYPGQADLETWKQTQLQKPSTTAAWEEWSRVQAERIYHHPLYWAPEPTKFEEVASYPRTGELQLTSNEVPEFDQRLVWISIQETHHKGNGKTYDGVTTRGRLKPDQFWFHEGASISLPASIAPHSWRDHIVSFQPAESHTTPFRTHRVVMMFRQTGKWTYSKITCIGLMHRNFVYGMETVDTEMAEAVKDKETSPFLVPLHHETMRNLGLSKSNQLALSSSYLVLNSVTFVKQAWYTKSFFRVVLIAAALILTIPSGGASLGSMAGILGTNAAVGTMLGASAASAAIVGAATNMIAAAVLSRIIMAGSKSLFGEKWGAVIGTIASFVAMTYGTQFARTGSFDVDWTAMLRAENLIKLTDTASKAYSAWLQADNETIMAELARMNETSDERLEEIQEASKNILGMTAGEIDPMLLTGTSEYVGESPSSFLNRTLLTGSDISELTHAMVENFAELSLELPTLGSTLGST